MDNLKGKPYLQILPSSEQRHFLIPVKRINDGDDVNFWLRSKAYSEIITFLLQLNMAMFPRTKQEHHALPSQNNRSSTVSNLRRLIEKLGGFIEEAPPDPGPRRFGNVSFRKWYQIVESRVTKLLEAGLPQVVLDSKSANRSEVTATEELKNYLMGSFGSSQRLDYGTGHELSFLAFIAGVWKLGGFKSDVANNLEKHIVLELISPYLDLIRKLIKTYNLEPAGTHGVWGLDDHSFLPYIFGSAQLSPSISPDAVAIPQEGSASEAPEPKEVIKKDVVDDWRRKNLYFGAVGFINDVKKGPFWEHSPMLYDISGVTAGWAKINKGMLKMFNVEVLSKFPVVQHFPFGSLFPWELDPEAEQQKASIHAENQPKVATIAPTLHGAKAQGNPPSYETASLPHSLSNSSGAMPTTAAPWARPTQTESGFVTGTTGLPATAAPWARQAPVSASARGIPSTRNRAGPTIRPPALSGSAAKGNESGSLADLKSSRQGAS